MMLAFIRIPNSVIISERASGASERCPSIGGWIGVACAVHTYIPSLERQEEKNVLCFESIERFI